MVVLHHLNNSRSQRILWLLEELGIDYEIERYERDPETMLAPDSLKKVHPLGKSPLVTDGERTLAESGAIIEYLLDEYDDGELRPDSDSDEFLQYRYWLHYAEGSAMPPLFLSLVFGMLPERAPWIAKPLMNFVSSTFMKEYGRPVIAEHMSYWENTLSKHEHFAGEGFTAADIQMSFPVEAAVARFGERAIPNVAKWLENMRARPAYQRALEVGGEYSLDYT
jgi:glutathione S-transferase